MKPINDDLIRDWLDAEERGAADAADAALFALFDELPDEAPSPGFAARTLERAAEAGALRTAQASTAAASTTASVPSSVPISVPISVRARLAALWLALMSLGTLAAASYVVTALPRIDFGLGLRGFTRLLSEAWQWLATGLVFWQRLAEIGTLVSKVVAVPQVAAILLASLVLAAAAFRGLQAILAEERNWTYVERH